ncbi:MAG: MarR family transcriptional regulator [Chloroflexi bacterium]|nr:MarR family transcriptional regulator [Chloroflexota bacterium]
MGAFKDTVGFNLVKLCKGYFNALNARLNQLDLYEGQDHLLRQLWEEDRLPQAELTRRLGVEAASVSKAIDRMEKAGLITRRPSPDDARANVILLTDAGRALEQPVREAWEAVEAQLLAQMTPEERLLLRRLLLQMRENLKGEV